MVLPLPLLLCTGQGDATTSQTHNQDCIAVVRLLLLACDAGLVAPSADPCASPETGASLEELLYQVVDTVVGAGSRAYVAPTRVDRALLVIHTLLTEVKGHGGMWSLDTLDTEYLCYVNYAQLTSLNVTLCIS